MTHRPGFRALDKDLGRIGHAEVAQMHAFRPVWRLGLAVLALVGGLLMVMALSGAAPGMLAIGAGLVVAAWLGVAIGANDVANSLGPAVGAGAIGLLPGLATLGRIGILICYDSEFPLLGRVLAQAGAQLLLVPSCTDTVAGFSRVRIGAMARALESQCVVVQAPTVGPCDWMPALDENRGRAAIYGPPDGFWPETGIIAEGEMDAPGWVRATVDLSRVDVSRRDGAVLPFAHWPEQEPCGLI